MKEIFEMIIKDCEAAISELGGNDQSIESDWAHGYTVGKKDAFIEIINNMYDYIDDVNEEVSK